MYSEYVRRFKEHSLTALTNTKMAALTRENEMMQIENARLKQSEVTIGRVLTNTMRRNASLMEIQSRYVPPCTYETDEEIFAVVKMAEAYRYVDDADDPVYMKTATHIFVRVQRKRLNIRLEQIRSCGDRTNADAQIVMQLRTPNAGLLFVAFRLLASDNKIVTVNATGGVLTATEEDLFDLVTRADEQRHLLIHDDHDYDDDDDDDHDHETPLRRLEIMDD